MSVALVRETESSEQPDGSADQSSASKALTVLGVLAEHPGGVLGVTEVAELTGLPKSTTHRLLKTLEDHGFVGRYGTKYRVGNRLLELGEAARWSTHGELCDAAREPLIWLFERSGGTVQLGVLKHHDVLLLDKVTGADGYRIPSRAGVQFPANCSALGKALLAFSTPSVMASALRSLRRATSFSIVNPKVLHGQLCETRSTGFSYAHDEAQLGVRCVAAPIVRDGTVIAAVSRSSTQMLTEPNHARLVREAAARISRCLPPAGETHRPS